MFFKFIGLFFLRNILIIHKGVGLAKLKATTSISLAISPVAFLFEKITNWYLSNDEYIHWVLLAIFVDWIVGVAYHCFKAKDFSWKAMAVGVLMKVFLVLMAGSLFEALPYFLKSQSWAADGLLVVTRLSVFMYPAASAWMNVSAITNGVFPPTAWTKKVKAFNETLDLRDLKSNDQNSNNNQI